MIAEVANIVRRLSVFLFSASIIPVMCNAEVMMPDFRSFYFHEFSYKTILPEPFGNVKIIVKEKGVDRSVQYWAFETLGKRSVVEVEDLGGVTDLSLPNISVLNSLENADGTIQGFRVSFEYGVPFNIELIDVPGCGSPCYVSVRSVITFSVSKNGEVGVERYNPALE